MPSPSPSPSPVAPHAVGFVEVLDSFVPLIVGLSWPVVVLVVLYKFRPQISSLLSVIEDKIRMSKSGRVGAGFVELTWGEVLERSAKSLEELPPIRAVSEARVIVGESTSQASGAKEVMEGARSAVRDALIATGAVVTLTGRGDSGDLLGPLAESLLARGRVGYAVVNAAYVLDDLHQMQKGGADYDPALLKEYLDLSAQLIARIPVES